MLSLIGDQSTEQADGIMRIPVGHYLDPDRWQREVDQIFRRVPLVMAASCQLPEPGSFLTRSVAGLPLLIVRGADGLVRTMLNVCRHRGAQVCLADEGSSRRFTCPYHAWSYDASGVLVGVPGRETFGRIDSAELGLRGLPTEERHGLVWAALTPGSPLDLDDWIGEMAPELDDLRLAGTHPLATGTLAGPNWKVAKDGYFDGYHFGSLHRTTLGTIYRSNTQTVDTFGPHQRICFATHDITDLRDRPEELWDPFAHLGTVVAVFPNTAFAGGTDGYLMSQVFPGPGPMESITIQTHLRTGVPDTEAERQAAMDRVRFLEHVVTAEDYATGLGINRALPSGANTEFVFGRNEAGNQHFHTWVERLVSRP